MAAGFYLPPLFLSSSNRLFQKYEAGDMAYTPRPILTLRTFVIYWFRNERR